MAGAQNGSATKGSNRLPNGHVANQPQPRSRRSPPSKSSFSLVSIAARLFVWYALVTAIFRCPTTIEELNDKSPQICRPYLTARLHIDPIVSPYYDTYAAPYVDVVRPYANKFNKQVVKPATRISKLSYDAYAAPRINQLKQYSLAQWNAIIVPQLQIVQARASATYDTYLAPHVNTISTAIEPHYGVIKENAVYVHKQHIAPVIAFSKPLAEKAYSTSQQFASETALPLSKSAWSSFVIFVDGTLVPTLRSLYRENVEPQINLIGDRLIRYREGRKIKAAVDEVNQSTTATEQYTSITEPEDELPTVEVAASSSNAPPPAETVPDSKDKIAAARDVVANDLHTWQEKFAVAADKGSDELHEQISDIMKDLAQSEIDGVAVGLVKALKFSAEKEMANVKAKINTIVSSLPDDADDKQLESAEGEVFGAIRASGVTVKGHAHKLRQWYNTFDALLDRRAFEASDGVINILDGIRDLGLTEIGMRWAWMDGITYKDWQKYHELKQQFLTWGSEVREGAMKHESLEKAKASANDVVSEGMTIAEQVATELARLKEVGKWKIIARDTSDNFETRTIPARAVRAKEDIVDGIKGVVAGSEDSSTSNIVSAASEAVLGTETTQNLDAAASTVTESASSISEVVGEASDAASESIDSATSSVPDATSSVISEASEELESGTSTAIELAEEMTESTSSASSTASSKIIPGAMAQQVKEQKPILDDVFDNSENGHFSEQVQSMAEQAGDKYAEITRALSEAILGTPTGTAESLANVATDRYSAAIAAASSIIYGTPTPLGASVAAQASSAYSDAVSRAQEQYAHAKSIASEQISGTPKPVHEQMFSSIESAYSGSVETASANLQIAIDAAKSQFRWASGAAMNMLPTPTTQGTLESISSIGSTKLAEALSAASSQYSSAKIAFGATPTPMHQQYLSEAQRKYYEAIGLAHDRFSEFVSGASAAVYGTPTPYYASLQDRASKAIHGTPVPAYQSLIDSAQSQYDQASSYAAAQYDAFLRTAKSAVGAQQKSPAQSVLNEASTKYSEALMAASQTLSSASVAASNAIYGTPAGSVESITNQASENWQALVSKASEQIYGQPTPFSESVISQAGEYSAQVTDAALAQYSAVQALVSELVIGKEPDFTESIMNQLSSAFYTGYHASLASSASSYANEAYQSASSVVSTYFTPPASLETILNSASDQLNAAVDAVSVQVYGSEKGTYEQAISAAAESYTSVSSQVSAAIYGSSTGYAEAAQSSIQDAVSNAQVALSHAIYGTPTGTVESATSVVADVASSVSSGVSEGAAYVSSVIWGPEKSTLESAQGRLSAAMESAQARLSELMQHAGEGASSAMEAAQSNIEDIASSISSAASAVTSRVRDEL